MFRAQRYGSDCFGLRYDAYSFAIGLLRFCWYPLMLAISGPGLSVLTGSSWGGLTRSGRDSSAVSTAFFFANGNITIANCRHATLSLCGVLSCLLPVDCYTHGIIIRKIHIPLATKTLVVSAMVHRFNRSDYPHH